jgi:putative membrane protein
MSVTSDALSSLRMIAYDPREWLRPVFQFHKSDTFRKLFLLILLIGAITGGVAWLENGYLHMSQDSRVKNITLIPVAGPRSQLLVFRTNTAYDRWWEGRKLWGRW